MKVWLSRVMFVPSCWFYLVMKCFLWKEGAAEAKQTLPGPGAAQQPEGKHLALGKGLSSQMCSPPARPCLDKAGRTRQAR